MKKHFKYKFEFNENATWSIKIKHYGFGNPWETIGEISKPMLQAENFIKFDYSSYNNPCPYSKSLFSTFEEAQEAFDIFVKDYAKYIHALNKERMKVKVGEITDRDLFIENL